MTERSELDVLTHEKQTVASPIKPVVSSELSHVVDVDMALACAVQAIYFDDNSDYITALWNVVGYLGGDAAEKLLASDSKKAYDKYC